MSWWVNSGLTVFHSLRQRSEHPAPSRKLPGYLRARWLHCHPTQEDGNDRDWGVHISRSLHSWNPTQLATVSLLTTSNNNSLASLMYASWLDHSVKENNLYFVTRVDLFHPRVGRTLFGGWDVSLKYPSLKYPSYHDDTFQWNDGHLFIWLYKVNEFDIPVCTVVTMFKERETSIPVDINNDIWPCLLRKASFGGLGLAGRSLIVS